MLETDCANVRASTCVGAQTPVVTTDYRVLASWAGESVTIPMLATVSLGASQVTNVFHRNAWGGSAGLCHYDFANLGLISVLGPPD